MSAEFSCVMYYYRPMVEEESPAVVIDEDPVVLLSANPRTTLRLKTRRTEEEQDYSRCQSKLSFFPLLSG